MSMSLENVDEYEADIRRRNLLHLKREHSRLFDASAIAKRFRLTDTTSGEGASGSREKEGIHPSSDMLDGLTTTDYGCPNQQGSRVGDNPGNCICGELVAPGNGGLDNNFRNTLFVKTLKFKLLDVPRPCSLVTGADGAGSGPSEVPYSGGIEGEVQDDSLKGDGVQLESPTVQSPIVRCTSDDDDDDDGASDDIGHVCQVETPAVNYVHQQGTDDRPLKMTSQLFSGQDSPEAVGSEPFGVSFSGGIEAEVQDDGGIETVGSPAVQSPIVRRLSDADGECDGIGNMCQAETLANSKVHEQGRDDCPPRMCHTVTSQLFSDQDSPGTGHQVHANLDVQFSKDGAGNLGHDSCGDDAGSHLSEKDKHLSSNQGQSVEESMVERQPVPTIVDYCAINCDGMETIRRKSFQSPVRHYSMRPRSSEKKEQYSSPQPVRHYSMRPRCSEKKKQYSSPRTLGGRRKLQWTVEEVKILEEGVQKLSGTNDKSMPWKEILKYGSDVFKSRTTVDLKDKWRNICKGKSKLG